MNRKSIKSQATHVWRKLISAVVKW